MSCSLPAGAVVGRRLARDTLGDRSWGRGGSRSGRCRLNFLLNGEGRSGLHGSSRNGGNNGSCGADFGGNVCPSLGDSSLGRGSCFWLDFLLCGGDRSGLGARRLLGLRDFSLDINGSRLCSFKSGFRDGFGGGFRSSFRVLSSIGLRSGLLFYLGSNLLKLLVHLGFGLLGRSFDNGGFGNSFRVLGLGLLGRSFDSGIFSNLLVIDEVSKYVVEDIVAIRLLSQNECLHELARWLLLIRNLANYRDEDIVKRGLGIHVQDAYFTVLKVQLLDLLLDGLVRVSDKTKRRAKSTHLLTDCNRDRFSFSSENQLRASRIKEV
jgi:hypothetical protein